MGFQYFAGAAFRALTARKDGPSLYDVCDPLLQKYQGGDPHLGQFYRTALGNAALRPLLRRTGLPALKDERRLNAVRAALQRARDEQAPDWAAVGAPVAELMGDIDVQASKARAIGPGPSARHARDRADDPHLRRRICCAPGPKTASCRPMPPSICSAMPTWAGAKC